MSSIRQVGSADFQAEVLDAKVPVLVDFYATWCGPCRMLAPVLEQLAVEYEGRAKIVKVDIDSEPALAAQFQVQSVPSLFLIDKGQPVAAHAGILPKPVLQQLLDKVAGVPQPKIVIAR